MVESSLHGWLKMKIRLEKENVVKCWFLVWSRRVKVKFNGRVAAPFFYLLLD